MLKESDFETVEADRTEWCNFWHELKITREKENDYISYFNNSVIENIRKKQNDSTSLSAKNKKELKYNSSSVKRFLCKTQKHKKPYFNVKRCILRAVFEIWGYDISIEKIFKNETFLNLPKMAELVLSGSARALGDNDMENRYPINVGIISIFPEMEGYYFEGKHVGDVHSFVRVAELSLETHAKGSCFDTHNDGEAPVLEVEKEFFHFTKGKTKVEDEKIQQIWRIGTRQGTEACVNGSISSSNAPLVYVNCSKQNSAQVIYAKITCHPKYLDAKFTKICNEIEEQPQPDVYQTLKSRLIACYLSRHPNNDFMMGDSIKLAECKFKLNGGKIE